MNNKYGWVCAAIMAVGVPATATAFGGNPDRGQSIFIQRCAICHGADGRGNDGMAADFQEEWYRLSKSDEELAQSIRNGLSTPGKFYTAGMMPPQMLSERDIQDVLAFLRERFLR